ncbi:MAG: substrate-binding domain-containing protein [Bacteroidales bacterium]|nr:substrate-binding domain-containing protein [Bacteroidales bacterium]
MVIGRKGVIRDVALGIRLRFKSGRDILRGISRYASRNCHWRLHIINVFDHNTVSEFKTAIARKVDGIILNGVVFPEITTLLKGSSIPLVAFGARTPELGRRTRSLAFVRNNDYAIGQVGADYMMSLGTFRSYIYIPTNQPSYASHLRQHGFTDRLRQKGIAVRMFPIDPSRLDGGYEEIKSLAEWLRALPKPIAAMAAFDQRAAHLLEAAQLCGLKVPGHLAVLGVDNDELICDFTTPPLTSIEPDHVHNGELAAAELERMMGASAGNIVRLRKSSRRRIVERQSARPIPPAAQLVSRGLAYISRNAASGITTSDVVGHLGVSRRLADLRFREFSGKTVHEAIVEARLEELKRRLRETEISIASLTAACGFESENYAKNLFKARFGMSMSTYRAGSSPYQPPRAEIS